MVSNGQRSDVIDITDDDVTAEPDPYLEVARRFFNQFLELKVSLDRDGAVPPAAIEKERERHEKELRKWRSANDALRDAAASLAAENERLEGSLIDLIAQRDNLRREINEMKMRSNETARKLREYPLDQHMSESAFKEWQKIMAEIPYAGSH